MNGHQHMLDSALENSVESLPQWKAHKEIMRGVNNVLKNRGLRQRHSQTQSQYLLPNNRLYSMRTAWFQPGLPTWASC